MVVKQYRYYGDYNPLTSNGSAATWISGEALIDLEENDYNYFIVKAPIGTRVYINGEGVTIGFTETYIAEAPINSFRVDEDSMDIINENSWNIVLTLEKLPR